LPGGARGDGPPPVDEHPTPGHDRVDGRSTDRAWDKAGRGRILGAIVAVSGILASGCGSAVNNGPVDASSGADGSGGATAHGSSNDGVLPACVWPGSLNPTDASDGRCVANQAYLSCRYSNGATEICLSDNLTQCPGPWQSANGTFVCQDQCEPGEYATTCGWAGVGGTPEPTPPPPPASCRFLAGAEGVSFGCCPCISDGGASDGGPVNRAGGASDAGYPPCIGGTCGPNLVCEYPIADGCSAKGICVPQRGCGGSGKQPTCCGCDGGGVLGTCDLPGYVTGSVQSFFAIDGGGSWSAACVPCGAGGPCICSDAGSFPDHVERSGPNGRAAEQLSRNEPREEPADGFVGDPNAPARSTCDGTRGLLT
jgi:hypothetical protein